MILKCEEKQLVTYCIPDWLRNEQIKLNTARSVARIQPVYRSHLEPVAIVGFGPSLNDTWPEILKFDFRITCSGAHRFLVERGIMPTWHVEVDPRAHKVALIGQPQQGTKYLIASACHPTVFEHLKDFQVLLWHVFDPSDDGWRLLPPGEWAITGGCDVGLRALTIAGFLGFRDLHVFGMDGCARETRHAGSHPHGGKEFAECEYKGVVYKTTPAMLAAAQQVWHELDQMPKVKATFYGEGLIQAMAKDYVPNPKVSGKPMANVVGVARPELISASYRDLNRRLHADRLDYGVGGARHADTVLKLAKSIGTQAILDYGCGKGLLGAELANRGIPIWEYDPAVPGKDASPRPADLVVCTDVLEHVEPDKLMFVLDDLRRLTRKLIYLVIHTGPATKTLADGRNAHLIQRPAAWWRKKLGRHFVLSAKSIIEKSPLLYIVASCKSLH